MGRSLATAPFRVWAVFHGLLVLTQVGLAGALLDAVDHALEGHGGVGGSLILVAMIQTALAVLATWPGGMPAWPIAAGAALVVADTAQVAIGHAGLLGLHVPLGVAIVAGQLAVTVRALRPARRATAARGESPAGLSR